jgi:nucleoside-diphosphate-sugar epimerase
VAALKREGVTAIGAGRDLHVARRVLPDIDWVACHFNKDVEVSAWAPRLEGIDAVVNCVGILQGSMSDSAERIHADATIVLFEACAAVGVKRIVHISAVRGRHGDCVCAPRPRPTRRWQVST